MSKYKHDGGSSIFTLFSKKAVMPLGLKRIRTSTGAFKSFSRSARGKRFPIFSKLRTRSSKNLKTKLNYMNERISGKTQKIEHYSARLKEAQILSASKRKGLEARQKLFGEGSSEWQKIQNKLDKLEPKLEKQLAKMSKKIQKAQKNLTVKLNRYKPRREKYEKLMQRKIYKSQKRLDKGFTKSCKNLKKTGQSSIGCLEAYEICKGKHANLDLKGLTACVNMESENMGLPSNLKEGQITETMTALANKHFIRRFKRRRHLREIKRISKHGDELEKSLKDSKGTMIYGQKLQAHSMNATPQSFNKLGQLSKERVIYKNIAKNNPGLSLAELEKKTYEKIDKTEITQQLRKTHPDITPDQLKFQTDEIYKVQKTHLNDIEKQFTKSPGTLTYITDRENPMAELRARSKLMAMANPNIGSATSPIGAAVATSTAARGVKAKGLFLGKAPGSSKIDYTGKAAIQPASAAAAAPGTAAAKAERVRALGEARAAKAAAAAEAEAEAAKKAKKEGIYFTVADSKEVYAPPLV
jgi:hypothetical protein